MAGVCESSNPVAVLRRIGGAKCFQGRLGENRRDRRRLLGVRRDDFGDPIPLHRVLYVRRGEDELDEFRAASEGAAAPVHDLPLVSSILLFVFVLLLAAAAGPEDPQALS